MARYYERLVALRVGIDDSAMDEVQSKDEAERLLDAAIEEIEFLLDTDESIADPRPTLMVRDDVRFKGEF